MITASNRPQPLSEQRNDSATVKTRGHLALLEWAEQAVPAAAPPVEMPLHRRTLDRCYAAGTLLLFAATIAALAASLCR